MHPPADEEETSRLPLRARHNFEEEEKFIRGGEAGGSVLLSDTSSVDKNPFEVCKDSPKLFQPFDENGGGLPSSSFNEEENEIKML